MQKSYVTVNICDNRNSIKPCNFLKSFEGFNDGDGM